MTNRPKDQEIPTVTLDDIAQCLRDELGSKIDIGPDSHGELLTRIKRLFESYWRNKNQRDLELPLFDLVTIFENAISSLDEVKPLYLNLPDYDLKKLYEYYVEGVEEKEIIISKVKDSDEWKNRRRKINALRRELEHLRDECSKQAKESNSPAVEIMLKFPEGWLTWILIICLRGEFPDRSIVYNYEIHNSVYSLLVLHGMKKRPEHPMSPEEQTREDERTGKMIESRFNRFSDRINPHLRPIHISVSMAKQRKNRGKKQ